MQSCLVFHTFSWLLIDYADSLSDQVRESVGTCSERCGCPCSTSPSPPLLRSSHGFWVELPQPYILGPPQLCRAICLLKVHQPKCKSHPKTLSQNHPE